MALTIEIPFKKEILSTKTGPEIMTFFKDPTNAIGKNFPGLESLSPLSDSTFRWAFENLSYGGYDLKIKFDTQFIWSEHLIEIKPLNMTGHRLSATWTIKSDAKSTKIDLDMKITLELPVPSLMKAMVQPLAQKELTKLLDRFTANIGRSLA